MYNTVNITFFRPPLIVDDFLAITQLIFGLMKVIRNWVVEKEGAGEGGWLPNEENNKK